VRGATRFCSSKVLFIGASQLRHLKSTSEGKFGYSQGEGYEGPTKEGEGHEPVEREKDYVFLPDGYWRIWAQAFWYSSNESTSIQPLKIGTASTRCPWSIISWIRSVKDALLTLLAS